MITLSFVLLLYLQFQPLITFQLKTTLIGDNSADVFGVINCKDGRERGSKTFPETIKILLEEIWFRNITISHNVRCLVSKLSFLFWRPIVLGNMKIEIFGYLQISKYEARKSILLTFGQRAHEMPTQLLSPLMLVCEQGHKKCHQFDVFFCWGDTPP